MDDLTSTLRKHGIETRNLRRWNAASEEIYLLDIETGSALAEWQKLRALVVTTGFWPVILGDQQDLRSDEMSFRSQQELGDAVSILGQAEAINGAQWLEKEWDEGWEHVQDREAYHASWPDDSSPQTDFARITDAADVIIGMIPTSDSWKSFAYLKKCGYWNADVSADVQVAIHRYWHNLYQTELVVATHDSLQLSVGRPPQTREEAVQLAQQQFMYCPDNIHQWMHNIEALAATLLNGTVWYFWWD
jgi:hypothetical protein